MSDITKDSARLISELPCFSPNLQCAISNLTLNDESVTVENMTMTNNDNGSVMAYSYPDHTILLSGQESGRSYHYCVIAVSDTNNMMPVGKPMCGNFITNITSGSVISDGMYIHSCVRSQLNIYYNQGVRL